MENNTNIYTPEKQVADHLNISVRTLQSLRLRGEGPPFYKLGGNVRYKFDEVDAWADQQKRTSTRGGAS